jgi:glycyl-tRNA synthetase beta chain
LISPICERFAPAFDIPAAVSAAGGDATIVEYVTTRLRQRFRDAGYRFDQIDAVTSWKNVGEFRSRLDDLKSLQSDAAFARLLEVAERCRNITKKADPSPPDIRPQLLVEAAEKALFAAWRDVRGKVPAAPLPLSRNDVARIAAAIADPLHEFFAKVFVNADDPAVRGNRLALLREIDATLLRFADLCRIQRG